jgi:adenylate kinase
MIALFGPPGSGKSSQGQILADKYGWRWLSVGQSLRDVGDPEIMRVLKEGKMYDDEYVIKMMHEAMLKAKDDGVEMVFDGYPGNKVQAEWLVGSDDLELIDGVVVLDVPMDELWRRVSERGREDDSREVVERRFEEYEQKIYSIFPLLKRKNVKITTVNGVGSFDEVTDRIEDVLFGWGVIDGIGLRDEEMIDDEEKSYGE